MIKEAIDRILELAEDPVIVADGLSYWRNGRRVLPPMAGELAHLESLSGLLSYLESPDAGEVTRSIVQIVVDSYNSVKLVGVPTEENSLTREAYVSAKCPLEQFPFGRHLDQETFIIRVQSQFDDNDQKSELIKRVSSIAESTQVQNEDDGISQRVVVEEDLRKGNAIVQPIWELRPYRTFPEVEQPKSRFLLRIRKGPEIALYEADGGMWRVVAARTVAEYLRNNERVKALNLAVVG